MSAAKFIALDFGAGSGRALLGKITDKSIGLEELYRFDNPQIKVHGHFYWDLLRLFEELKTGLRNAALKGHKDIHGIGVDTWGVDFGLVARDNTLLGNPYAYRDSRTDGMMEAAFSFLPKDEIYNYTGIQFMQLNSIFQLYSMVKVDHPWLDVAEQILFMPDLFNFLMTGVKVSEYTMASTSQLLNATTKQWEANIFAKLNLPMDLMGDIIQPGWVVGSLLSEISKDVGLTNIDVITPGCHDTASAVAAVPATGENWAYLSSGTWSLLGIESKSPIINEDSLKYNFTNEGGVGNTTRFLRNAMGMWLLEGVRNSWKNQGQSLSYEKIIALASEATPFKCIIDPDDPSFLNPPDMVVAIDWYCSQRQIVKPQTQGEYIRTIFESLALKYRWIIDKINSMRKFPIEKIYIVGGGCQNKLLNQFTANATGLLVYAGPVEATGLGNIMMQGIAKGIISSIDEGRRLVAQSFPSVTFYPEESAKWIDKYKMVEDRFK